jgi:hypothetical protein
LVWCPGLDDPRGNAIRLPIDPVPDEYDLRLELERTRVNQSGSLNAIHLAFVMGGRQGMLSMDARRGQQPVWALIMREGTVEGEIEMQKWEVDQRHAVTLQVRRNRVTVRCDGKTVIDREVLPEDLSVIPSWKPVLKQPMLALCAHASFGIHSATFAPVGTQSTKPTVVNLLPLIDPKKDTVKGGWAIEKGELRVESSKAHSVLEIPYRPPEEYDFRVEFTRLSGSFDVSLALTKGDHSFQWCAALDDRLYGFGQVGGRDVPEWSGSVIRPNLLQNGKRHTALVQVRRGGVKAFFDGKLLNDLSTDGSDLSMYPGTRLRDDCFLGLTTWTNAVVFHKIEVVEVSGPGTRPSGWVDLFNGKDLSGWETVGKGEWVVEDNMLRTKGTDNPGWLATDRDYGDFELEFEYRLGPRGNSGVFVHAWKDGPPNGGQFLEVQLIDDKGYNVVGKLNGTAAIFEVVAPKPTVETIPNTWYKVSIRSLGRRLQVTFDGKRVIDTNLDDHAAAFARFPGLKRTTGRIGLQHYGTPADFRNIRLRSLSP